MWVNYGVALANLWVFDFWGAAYYTYVAIGWGDGMNWWRYDSDRGWNYLIGADIPATQTVCFTDINWQGFNDCMSQYNGQQATYEQYIQCQNQHSFQNCYTYYSSQNGQSDAFIKAPSQAGYNSGWSNNATRVEARGVNHSEMNRHPAMGIIYNRVFNGQVGADPFFFTP